MTSVTRRHVVAIAAVLFALAFLAPSLASAQMRQFKGRIDRINEKKMIVDNRMGDKVSFVPVDTTEVSGEGKTKWSELKKDDWVNVHWKFVDKPRKAYKVDVLPPKDEAGEDD